ncbi:MAG: Rieske (2Fe-2S) protein [Chloroflexota bacterium]|nr:Rieske (2Fe-2S) protein [Chloroflexota bacterium]
MMPYETYVNLIRQLDDLVAVFEHHPDPVIREQVVTLLEGLDALHREGLQRLVGTLRDAGADALVEQAASDPVVKVLLGLYDLVDLDLPEAPPSVPPSATAFIPLEQVSVLPKPQATWVEIARTTDLPPGTIRAVEVDEIRVLLINLDGEIYAYRNACPGSDLPLTSGLLEGHELVCPWHGCRFDARTGHRRDEGKGRLEVLPVAVRGPSIQLAWQQSTGNVAVSWNEHA